MKWYVLVATLGIFAACLVLEYGRLTSKPFPGRKFADPVEEFKYGSIGAEVNGFPYAIWRELPTIFPDELPRGWETFGFLYEKGHGLPVGISVRRVAVRRAGFNCATCHTSRLEGQQTLILGAPAERLDLQAYLQFLQRASLDPRLTPDAVFTAAEANGRPFNPIEKAVHRYFVFPRLKSTVDDVAQSFAWMKVKPEHGPGRTDAGNAWRARWGLHPERDMQVGTVDFPSVWNQRLRTGGWYHWDGNNSSLEERNYSAALAGGATDWLLDRRSIGKLSNWLLDLPPPRFPGPIDTTKAAQGRAIYQAAGCGGCHDQGGPGFGGVTPVAQVGTDPARVSMFTPDMVRRFHQVGAKYTWRFSHYRSSGGYANVPLDGIWARGPYLHNGSVPTLTALLSPPAARPVQFYRGCTRFDPADVGFACDRGFLFDTRLVGNGNGGHTYGSELSPEARSALVEYLKTL
jgi:mono/diheme cytochrome c family protein